MRVLLISRTFPYPPIDGEVLPIYHFLRELASEVKFRLVTRRPANLERWKAGLSLFQNWGIEVEAVEPTLAGTAAQAWRCLRDRKLWINRFYEPDFAELTRRELAKGGWDAVQAEGIMSAQHLPRTPLPCGSLLMARDCLSLDHWRRWKHERSPRQLLQSWKIRWMESAIYARFDRVAAISPVDAEAMRRIRPGLAVELIPNGVDTQTMRPAPELEEEGTVLFSGAMDHGPNVDAALWLGREIWPLVRRECPAARLVLVGRDPVAEVRALAEDPTIAVPGTVEDMRPWLARASVVVAPMRLGTGLKNKILEGAAMGRAMVATPLALEGLDFAAGHELWVAGSAAEFAEEVATLLKDAHLRGQLGAHARRGVETRYSWPSAAQKLLEVYRKLAERKD